MYIRIFARAMKRDVSKCHKVFVFENYFKRIGSVKEIRKTQNQKQLLINQKLLKT